MALKFNNIPFTHFIPLAQFQIAVDIDPAFGNKSLCRAPALA